MKKNTGGKAFKTSQAGSRPSIIAGALPARPPRAICVYCGSGKGLNPRFAEAARVLGRDLAKAGIGLVYGGATNGLMGETARAVLANGGHVTGIMPETLTGIEPPLREVQELIMVRGLHERKMLMFEKSDAFVALPGGLGTLEELVEQLTWVQLRHHKKPVVVADIDGYWQPLLSLLQHMRDETFIREGLKTHYLTVTEANAIIPAISAALGDLDQPLIHPAA